MAIGLVFQHPTSVFSNEVSIRIHTSDLFFPCGFQRAEPAEITALALLRFAAKTLVVDSLPFRFPATCYNLLLLRNIRLTAQPFLILLLSTLSTSSIFLTLKDPWLSVTKEPLPQRILPTTKRYGKQI